MWCKFNKKTVCQSYNMVCEMHVSAYNIEDMGKYIRAYQEKGYVKQGDIKRFPVAGVIRYSQSMVCQHKK